MSLPSSMADFVSCDRLLQKAYFQQTRARRKGRGASRPFHLPQNGKEGLCLVAMEVKEDVTPVNGGIFSKPET